MQDSGFNPNGSDFVKEAFIKYLIKQSTGISVQTPSEKKIIQQNPQKIVSLPHQLEFDFFDNESNIKKKA